HQPEYLGERRYPGGWHRKLIREPRRVSAARTNLPDVVLLDLRKGQLDERNAGGGHIASVGSARKIRIETALVRDNDHGVLGDSQVEFERVHAHRQGIGKGLQRVLRAKRAPAAMRLDVEPRVARSRCAARSIPCKSGHK